MAPQHADTHSPERIAELYPALFSAREFRRWQALFDRRATLARIESGVPVEIQSLADAMPEQVAYAGENHDFVETWHNVRIQRQGQLAVVIADYSLTVDHEIRTGTDLLTLACDGGRWRILHLAYEQTGRRDR